jgi:PAS domain S-box-containing protein
MTEISNRVSDAMPDLLLVEDNPLHIRLVQSMLSEIWPDGDSIRTAMRLDTALRELSEQRPDCVLLDLILPDADHLESVKAVHGAYPDIPIVVLSAHEDDELALSAVAEGAQDYLTKGVVTPVQLGRTIRFAISRQRALRNGTPETSVEVITETAAGLAVLDTAGTIRLAEPSLAEWLDLDGDRLVGQKVTDLTIEEDVDRWDPVLARRAGTAIREVEARMHGGSGRVVNVRVQVTALTNGTVTPAGYLALWYVSDEMAHDTPMVAAGAEV